MPLPSLVGVKSMRKLPGTDIASYHFSIFDVPSGSTFVVRCTNVAVLYHDFPYFFCIAAISSLVFEIFAYAVAGNSSKEVATSKKKNFIIVPRSGDSNLRSLDGHLCAVESRGAADYIDARFVSQIVDARPGMLLRDGQFIAFAIVTPAMRNTDHAAHDLIREFDRKRDRADAGTDERLLAWLQVASGCIRGMHEDRAIGLRGVS